MGLLAPGLWYENSDLHSAQEYRLLLEALVGGRAGVWPSTSLVTETTGSERKVRVLGGRHYIWPRTQTHQGMGHAYNDGDVDLDIDAADPALPRIDLVIVEADDEETGGTVANTTQFRVVTGTPNASPSPPAVPDDAMALAEVEVAAAASVIVDADITDLPQLVTAVGGVRVCTSTTHPATPHEGMEIYETDTDRKYVFDGSAWVPIPVGRRFNAGTSTASTDAGGNITIAHGLGATPTAVTAMLRATNTASVMQVAVLNRGGVDATNFVIYVVRSDTGAALASTAVHFDWIATT